MQRWRPFDPEVKRTEGTVKDTRSGQVFKTSKGAPHIILRLLPDEDSDSVDKIESDVASLGAMGIRCLAVAKTDSEGGQWKMMGLLTFLDPPRDDTKQTLNEAAQHGIEIKMVTGTLWQ
jgi:H+-transporting ATPase